VETVTLPPTVIVELAEQVVVYLTVPWPAVVA
jgi:hypothetical protein